MENIHQNAVLEYVVYHPRIFDSLVYLLTHKDTTPYMPLAAVFLLVFVLNFRKYETKNPALQSLAGLSSTVTIKVTSLLCFFGCNVSTKAFYGGEHV